MSEYALELNDVSFAYEGARPSITDINLAIAQGECHVLMGASGSGKTTIIRTINGLAGGYYTGVLGGCVRIGGKDSRALSSWQRASTVGSVFQDPASQFFSAQLAGEIAFGCENLGIDHDAVVSRADAVIEHMNVGHLRGSDIDTLSSGEKQKVAIASTLAPAPTILAMDEPSANLDTHAAGELGNILARLKKDGYPLIVAEHRIAYLMDVADYFHYVSDGTIVRTFTRDDVYALSDSERSRMGIRSPFRVENPEIAAPAVQARNDGTRLVVASERQQAAKQSLVGGNPHNLLEVCDLTVRLDKKDSVTNVKLRLKSGTITAITGENGAGKTTLMRAIAGLTKTASGTITLNCLPLSMRARRQKIWSSPNDLSAQFFTASVGEEIMLQVDPNEENIERARSLLRNLGLYEHKDHHPYALSGGQKQRLALACGLMQARPVLIFDEPTSGLDSINMERLANALRLAASEGATIAVVTHDHEFIDSCATHLYHQKSPREQAFAERNNA